jgi:aspartate-semialdehyde dehydrogenase
LIVPEINASSLTKETKSLLIQIVLQFRWFCLAPLHKNTISNVLWFLPPIYHRNRCKAVEQLENEYAGVQGEMAINTLFIEMQFHNVMCLKKTDTPKKK